MTTTTRPATPVAANRGRRPGAGALALRQGRLEITQFLRSRESVVFTMGFPIIMILIFASIFGGEIGGGVKFTQYFITGMIATGLMTVSFQNLGIWIPIERDRGVLKRYRGTPMPKWVWFAGKVIMVVAIGIVETALLLAVAVALFDLDLPGTAAKWLTFGWVSVLGVTACTLCGIAISSLARTARSGSAVVTPVSLVLQFISGVFFVFTELPTWMQQVAALFPLKWMCQGLRAVFLPESFGAQEPGGSYELGRVALVLILWCVIGLVLCLTTFRWTTKRDG
ncbi:MULTISPECIES: ABC transporter permease [Micromonospora]|uniref:Transport permease protein n=1 Tax=Micromonospora profundi TaxID=1420889 RepID=A0AAJ6L099_9ACTN|nr:MULTISPECIES: ABC transporter permease [Micromonospora]KOX08761.1 ABC transporter [Micromonospora sp. NRRL B-16802]NJC10349.1 ABC-2 type transport system permease protein [Micromonospora profundi]WLS47939.1 ABC transporter permease [Micromonospora profundi]